MVTKTVTVTVRPAGTKTKTLAINVAPSGAQVAARKSIGINVLVTSQQRTKTLAVTVRPAGTVLVAGPNRTVEAGEVFTLTPQTETPASGASITSRAWQRAGVTVASAAVAVDTAPITRLGTDLSYTYTVTDSNGASTSSSLVVTARPAPIRGRSGVPLIERVPYFGALTTSSAPMPTTEPAGFTRVYAEDFNDRGDGLGAAYPEGAFIVGGANQANDGRILPSSPAYARYGPGLNLFPDGYPDTDGFAYNWPSRTVSVRTDVPDANGAMQIRLRTETINGTPTALTAAVRPVLADETQQEQSYGRLSMRIKADPVTGYGAVMLMIANGTVSGEIDWFEGGLAQAIHGYFHGTDGSRTDITTASPAYLSDWHVLTIERRPTAINLLLDEVLVRTITAQMSTALMKNVLQIGGDDATPPAGSAGLVLVDWITFGRWTG